MTECNIYFPEINYHLHLAHVKGTGDGSYLFGNADKVSIRLSDYYISIFLITQQVWDYVMGYNPSHFKDQDRPVENVSYNDITQSNGFLERLNIAKGHEYGMMFRLPSETEWEYAARGGIYWNDNFLYSGSHNINDVGWYDQNSGKQVDVGVLSKLKNHEKGTTTHKVGQKRPNQLDIYDMSGNVWEWCQDYFQNDVHKIPKDGTPYSETKTDRVLRGGCHHNWAIHCTVSKRYEIVPEAKDECIGFRIVASVRK